MSKRSLEPIGNYSKCNKVTLIKGGKEYFHTLIEYIDRATSIIHLQIYIFDDDETGNSVKDALIRASARKVLVFVVVDGYASNLPSEFVKELKDACISFRWFEPLMKSR